ncbi:MAG: SPOR domain-containing protein [Melioribacteraceae bacterium]|nr:SPOR domain-containing protein [Melioribacteraceae bacterium]
MTKAEFYNKIVEFLGVSFSERYLAGDLLIEKIAGSISQNQSLEIKNFGKFSKMENKENSIVFIDNISENPIKVTFEIKNPKAKNEVEDDTAFSLGVGKPLIPLKKADEWGGELDTSLTILKKSLNERISEYLSKAVINDINDINSHRGESSAFLNYTLEEDINSNQTEASNSDRDLINLLNDYSEMSNPDLLMKVEKDDDKEENENEFDQILKSMLAERDDEGNYSPPEPTELDEKEETIAWDWGDELKKEIVLNDVSVEDDDSNEQNEIEYIDEEKLIDQKESFAENKKEDLFEKLAKTIKQSETDINKIKKNYEFEEEPVDEDEQFEEDKKYQTRDGKKGKYEFRNESNGNNDVKDTPPFLGISKEFNSTFANDRETKEEKREVQIKKEPIVNKKVITAIGLLLAVIIIAAGGYYFLFMIDSGNSQLVLEQKLDDPVEIKIDATAIPKKNDGFNNDTAEEKIAEKKNEADKSVVSSKVTEKSKDVASKPSDNKVVDKKVANLIFFDGQNYNVQVSSWRNKSKAIDEVARLKRTGLDVFVLEAYIPEKGGNWYRVRVGNFKSINEAKTFLSKQ